jgi:hypothetical protein
MPAMMIAVSSHNVRYVPATNLRFLGDAILMRYVGKDVMSIALAMLISVRAPKISALSVTLECRTQDTRMMYDKTRT